MPADDHRAWRIAALFAAALGIVIFGYPYAIGAALGSVGVRGAALALLALAAASLFRPAFARVPLAARAAGRPFRAFLWGAAPALALPVLLLLAAVTGNEVHLLLVPAAVYLTLAGVFLASLRAPDSIIERAARFLVPQAPGFIRSYCRKLTALWATLFAACSAAIAALAIAGDAERWRALTGWGVYALMFGLMAGEFLVRKTWFRYYFHDGPFERFWSRLFPAEATPRGRESLEFIRRYHAELEAERFGGEQSD